MRDSDVGTALVWQWDVDPYEGGGEGGVEGANTSLVVPVIRSCQSPTWIWLVNYSYLHLHYTAYIGIRESWILDHPQATC